MRNAILHERQEQLQRERVPSAAAARLDHSPRSRPGTAGQGTRPKVTCAMLNETERMLLRAPNRHKSMLSAGARASPPASRGAPAGLPLGTGAQSSTRPPCNPEPLTPACPRASRRAHLPDGGGRIASSSGQWRPLATVLRHAARGCPRARAGEQQPRPPGSTACEPLADAAGGVGRGCGASATQAEPASSAPRGRLRRCCRRVRR